MDIGERLKIERQRLGIGSADMAARMGVSKATQYNYENTERVPDAASLAACGDKTSPVTGASAPATTATTTSAPTSSATSSMPSTISRPEGPPYDHARAFYNELRSFQAEIGLWHQKPVSERQKLTQNLMTMSTWVDQSWPQSERCKGAVNMAATMASDMNIVTSRATSGDSVDMHNIQATIYNAVVFGQNMADCYDEVEALDVSQ